MAMLYGTLAAVGSDQAGAAQLVTRLTQVTGADGSVGVRLPGAKPNEEFRVYNPHATAGLKVYPHSGGDINDGTTDAAVSIEGKSLAIFVGLDGTTWAAIYTVNT